MKSLKLLTLETCVAHHVMPSMLPWPILLNYTFEYFRKIWEAREFDYLHMEYSKLDIFSILLDNRNRTTLLKSFSSTNIYGKRPVAEILLESYKMSNDVDLGLKLGEFFIEHGDFMHAITVLKVAREKCGLSNDQYILLLECYSQLLYAQLFLYKIEEAIETYSILKLLIEDVKERPFPNCSNVYSTLSFMYYRIGEYCEAVYCAVVAIESLNDQLPAKVIIKVLRLSAKAFVVSRKLFQARLVMEQAILLAGKMIESDPYVYAEVNMDYGVYLFNLQNYGRSYKLIINKYKEALRIYRDMFGRHNLYLLIVHRDIAYIMLHRRSMVSMARLHLARAIANARTLDPHDHFMFHISITENLAMYDIMRSRYGTNDSDQCRMYLKDAKRALKRSLREHKRCYRLPYNHSCIKIVNCLLKLGRVCEELNQYGKAERYFQRAEDITIGLSSRSNAEYLEIKIHRSQLYRFDPRTTNDSFREMIEVMEFAITTLTKLEGLYSESLGKFYKELLKLYNRLGYPAQTIVNLQQDLFRWTLKFEAQNFTPLTSNLSLIPVSMENIKNSIHAMNLVSVSTYGLGTN